MKCGTCGETIIPITKPNKTGGYYEVYDCYGRTKKKNGCTLRPVPRVLVDSGVCDYFMNVAVDVEATRAQLGRHRESALSEVAALLATKERDAQAAEDRLARVRRDYQDGKLDADDWADQRVQLAEEATAANDQLSRLQSRQAETRDSFDSTDLEAEALRRLADVRAAIIGSVRNAQTVEATRAALGRLFEGFTLHHLAEESQARAVAPEPRWEAPELTLPGFGGLYVEPHVRAQAIDSAAPDGFEGEVIFPTLHREALPLREEMSERA